MTSGVLFNWKTSRRLRPERERWAQRFLTYSALLSGAFTSIISPKDLQARFEHQIICCVGASFFALYVAGFIFRPHSGHLWTSRLDITGIGVSPTQCDRTGINKA